MTTKKEVWEQHWKCPQCHQCISGTDSDTRWHLARQIGGHFDETTGLIVCSCDEDMEVSHYRYLEGEPDAPAETESAVHWLFRGRDISFFDQYTNTVIVALAAFGEIAYALLALLLSAIANAIYKSSLPK